VSRLRVVLALLALAVAGGRALAGFTSPTLVLSAAHGDVGAAGRAAAFEGSFDFPNAVQVGYPLNLVVFQGSTFARYPAAGVPVAGTSAALADGTLAEAEVAAFASQGSPAAPPVRVVTMTPSAIRVTLPASFTAGPATGVLFTILADGTVLSNAIDFVLP
jgi:hypothetical protein